jgi:hypothetical protein
MLGERAKRTALGRFPRLLGPSRAEQVAAKELDLDRLEIVLIGLLGEAVALILADDVPDRDMVLPERGDHLLGLGERHSGVVLALDDQDRGQGYRVLL